MVKYEISKSGSVLYRIDDDNRTVEATIKCNPCDPQLLFDSQLYRHILGNGDGVVDNLEFAPNKFKIAVAYTGRSKCHPDDIFDVEYGKRLALLRAKEKYQKAVEKKLFSISQWISTLCGRVSNLYSKHYRALLDTYSDLYQIEKSKEMYN